jgi:NADH-quinone oxidoreductase chain G
MIKINDKEIKVSNWDYTVLQLCEQLGISIPRFCYHRELTIAGNCRMCMIEIKNSVKPIIACATSLSDNMNIYTNSELVKIARENVLELLLINHPLDCPICDQGGECDLQDQTMIYGSDRGRFKEVKRSVEDKYFGPIVKTIMTRCIHCTRCIRYSEEIIGMSLLGTMGRGKETEISTYITMSLQSELIGNIVDICPVGALTLKPYAFRARPWELQSIEAMDIFDSLVSRIQIQIKGEEIMRILPIRNDLLNREWITDKIRFFYEGALLNRLLFPMVNIYNKYKEKQLVHCSLIVACTLYINKYKESISKKEEMLLLCNGEFDLMGTYFIKEFAEKIGIDYYNTNINNKNLNIDFRDEWLLNEEINKFIELDNLVFVNINLKYENSILNSLLFQNINETENRKIYYIGVYNENIYTIKHIGLGINILRMIQEGKNEFNYNIKKEKCTWVDSDIKPLVSFSLKEYINTFNLGKKNKNKNNYSYIAKNSTELNFNECGVESINFIEEIKQKKISFLHILGELEKINVLESDFIVYQSHHFPEKKIDNYDLFLPVINFYEIGFKLSDMIWLNNELKGVYFEDAIITAPGDAKSNEYYYILLMKLIKKELLDVVEEIELEKYYNILEIDNLYKETYKKNWNILHYNINNVLINKNILEKVMPSTYYKNNIYSKNSITMNTVYMNEKEKIKKRIKK